MRLGENLGKRGAAKLGISRIETEHLRYLMASYNTKVKQCLTYLGRYLGIYEEGLSPDLPRYASTLMS